MTPMFDAGNNVGMVRSAQLLHLQLCIHVLVLLCSASRLD